jgi:sulfur carrier protein
VNVHVNGAPRELATASLLDLLATEGIAPDARGVAVAVNDRVVTRASWPDHTLAEGDRVEIVRATQGG